MSSQVKNVMHSANSELYAGLRFENTQSQSDSAKFNSEKKNTPAFNYTNGLASDNFEYSIQKKETEASDKKEKTKKTLKTIGLVALGVSVTVAAAIILKKVHNANKIFETVPSDLSEVAFIKTEQPLKDIIAKLELNSYINDTCFLGEGAEAAVYRISGTPYALRVPHIGDYITEGIVRGKYVDISKLSLSVSPQDKVNNIVGHLGDATIVRYIEGKNTISDLLSKEEVVDAINNLSKDSIKDYFLSLVKANRVGMRHDYEGANCVIDCTTGKLTPIDFFPGQDFKLLNSLMNQCAETPEMIGGTDNQNNLLRKGIIAILEMIKAGTISAKEVDISKIRLIYNETPFAKNMLSLCESFTKDSSLGNIDRILTELKI